MYADIDRMSQVFSAEVSALAKIVFIALVYHAKWETREAFPSWKTLSRETGLSRATVDRALRQLVAAKLVTKRYRADGRGCIYRISECGKVSSRGSQAGPNGLSVIPEGSHCDTIGVSQRDLGGLMVTPEGSHCDTIGVSQRDPNKSIEQNHLTEASTAAYEEEYMFEEFWEWYPAECPHKVDKAKCRELYRQLLSAAPDPAAFHGAVLASLGVWRRSRMWRQEGGRYIRSPYNWLVKRSWEDSPDLEPAEQGRPSALDWTLCIERCRHCSGNGCAKGVRVPPAQNKGRPFPPEECPYFSQLVA